jgi:uncharacterized protein (DUF362 family)
MKRGNRNSTSNEKFSRRKFLRTMGTTTAGLLAAPYISSSKIFAYGQKIKPLSLAKVAITEADSYERSYVKQKVQHLFESIDGITDIVKSGDKVAIKINLTGGSGLPENMWTHPEVLRAVGELIMDCGVSAQNLYIVEALWSDFSYNFFGYLDVQNSLGANMVNLNNADPYTDFMEIEVGNNKFEHDSFLINQILNEVDVYVSIPKMKQHYEAGITCSLKNQVGMVPKDLYIIEGVDEGRRAALHSETGGPSNAYLPRSICDLNLARPVHLAVIDGIVNARGGEGNWNPTFQPCEDHILLAGKDPVATDSVAAYFMGNDPEAEILLKPDGGQCDNHLHLLHQIGVGTNQMNEIEIVGDGAGLITSIRPDYKVTLPSNIKLLQNYPNPFNPSTIIRFYLPQRKYVNIKIYSVTGQEIETLINGYVPAGQHELHWAPNGQASGVYIYKMIAGNYVETKKMIYQK